MREQPARRERFDTRALVVSNYKYDYDRNEIELNSGAGVMKVADRAKGTRIGR